MDRKKRGNVNSGKKTTANYWLSFKSPHLVKFYSAINSNPFSNQVNSLLNRIWCVMSVLKECRNPFSNQVNSLPCQRAEHMYRR